MRTLAYIYILDDWVKVSYDLMDESYESWNNYGEEFGVCFTCIYSLPESILFLVVADVLVVAAV